MAGAVPIEVTLTEDGFVVIPRGMTPIFVYMINDKYVAQVEEWTPEKEFDSNRFDLYPLAAAETVLVTIRTNGELERKRLYHHSFGQPTMEAIKVNGQLHQRERTTTSGA